jgi:hypothetical protein
MSLDRRMEASGTNGRFILRQPDILGYYVRKLDVQNQGLKAAALTIADDANL